MVRSIRFKLLVYMTVNILLFAVLLYGSNTFFAERYYIEQKKDTLIDNSRKLAELINGKIDREDFNEENLLFEIDKIERSIGGSVMIGTADGKQYYPVTRVDGNPQRLRNNSFIPYNYDGRPLRHWGGLRQSRNNIDILEQKENSAFFRVEDPRLKIDTLRYQTRLDNGLLLQIGVPMAGISESAAISNRFTTIIGILTILLTGVWALFISGKFTKPIMQINKITKKMSELDFSETIHIKGNDEIAQLSHSINNLSYELNKAIGQLNSKNRQLEEDIDRERKLDKMRQEFVSSVSHELKTPIFLIQGYADGLKANIAENEEKRNYYCDVIMEEADKMNVLVKDLLDLSQIQSGMFNINRCEFNISNLAKDVLTKFKPVFEEKRITMEVETMDDLVVNADPVRIEQVIVNYLNNAVNHVNEKRKIKVVISGHEEKAKISIYNTGKHIPEDALEKIWSSFYKVDQARTREYGGIGLGLSIVRAIMEAHKSRYGVNNVEEGVEFWFEVDLVI